MVNMIQLNPPVPLETPKGKGLAFILTDYGVEHNLMWTVAIDATGELWSFKNPEVRAQKNITMGRIPKDEIGEYVPLQNEIIKVLNYIDAVVNNPTIAVSRDFMRHWHAFSSDIAKAAITAIREFDKSSRDVEREYLASREAIKPDDRKKDKNNAS